MEPGARRPQAPIKSITTGEILVRGMRKRLISFMNKFLDLISQKCEDLLSGTGPPKLPPASVNLSKVNRADRRHESVSQESSSMGEKTTSGANMEAGVWRMRILGRSNGRGEVP